MKKKPKAAAEISHDEVTPPMGTLLEEEATDDAPAEDAPTGWDANGSEVTTATVGEIVAAVATAESDATPIVQAALAKAKADAERAARHAALPDTVDLPGVPSTAAERCLSQEERAQIATHGHVLGREQ